MASTILIVIVLMVTMVFQQSIGSWASGSRRADTQMTVRTIVGTIQRDLVNAIPDTGNEWGDKRISFLAITGTPEGNNACAVQEITYSYSGGFVKRQGDDGETTLNPDCPLKAFSFEYPASRDRGLPSRVDVKIEVETEGNDGHVEARSLGPDGIRGTKDDIVVGGRQ